jgi:hypothetical protein
MVTTPGVTPARYPGLCWNCEEPIWVGEPIKAAVEGIVHADCIPVPHPERVELLCRKCWLSDCECEADR